jgi:hypothetical protein
VNVYDAVYDDDKKIIKIKNDTDNDDEKKKLLINRPIAIIPLISKTDCRRRRIFTAGEQRISAANTGWLLNN